MGRIILAAISLVIAIAGEVMEEWETNDRRTERKWSDMEGIITAAAALLIAIIEEVKE